MRSTLALRRIRLGAWIAAAAIALSCSDPIACDICTTSAIVYGVVRDSDGQPIEGVPVAVDAYLNACDGLWRGEGIGHTDTTGYFRTSMVSIFSPFTARCFVAKVNQNADPRWPTGVAEVTEIVEFRSDYDGSRRDSVRLDVTLEE